MSIHVMNEVWRCDLDLSPSEMLVLLALADWANDSGVCWPGVESIAKKTRQGGRNTRYILIKLERMGVIFILKPGGGRRVSNTYQINLQSLHRLETLQSSAETLQNTTENHAIAIAPEPSLTIKEPSYTRSPNFTNDGKSYVNGDKLPASIRGGLEKKVKPVKRAKLPDHIGVQKYYEVRGVMPKRESYSLIAQALGEHPTKADLDFWSDVIRHYVSCGWNPMNVSGMIDWYKRRELPHADNGNGRARSTAPQTDEGPATLEDVKRNNPALYERIIARQQTESGDGNRNGA